MRGSKANKCVECGDHVPVYTNFLCESCWGKSLNEKLLEDEKRADEARKIDIESVSNKWY